MALPARHRRAGLPGFVRNICLVMSQETTGAQYLDVHMFANRKLESEWWQPSRKRIKFKGVLEFDENNNGRLTLSGKRQQLIALPETLFVLHGYFKADYTYAASIFDAGVSKRPSSMGKQNEVGTAELFTNIVIVGAHVRSDKSRVAIGAQISLTGLLEWCDSSGVAGKIERPQSGEVAGTKATITHSGAATAFMNAGKGTQLRLINRYKGPVVFEGLKSATIEESDQIELRFKKPISIKSLLSEVLVWQSFLAFAIRRASTIIELRYRERGSRPNAFSQAVLVPVQKFAPGSIGSVRASALFLRSTLGNRVSSSIRAWAEAFADFEMAIFIFCGGRYQDGGFVHSTLLTNLQALEVFHREGFPGEGKFPDAESRKATLAALRKAIPKTLDADLRKRLGDSLGYLGSLSLLERLQRLYCRYPKSITPLFPDGLGDLKRLRDARNFLTHYGEKSALQKDFLTSKRVLTLREKTRYFMEACLAQLASAMQRYRNCSAIRLPIITGYTSLIESRR